MMLIRPQIWLLAATALMSGCAPAYHSYRCGCVPYEYAAPPPLPFGCYESCPTPAAAAWGEQIRHSAAETAR